MTTGATRGASCTSSFPRHALDGLRGAPHGARQSRVLRRLSFDFVFDVRLISGGPRLRIITFSDLLIEVTIKPSEQLIELLLLGLGPPE